MKDSFLQIRISSAEKEKIKSLARLDNCDISEWILKQLEPKQSILKLQQLYSDLEDVKDLSYKLAEISDFFYDAPTQLWSDIVNVSPSSQLSHDVLAYVASMIEYISDYRKLPLPTWTKDVTALDTPYFYDAKSAELKMFLCLNSPIQFKRRNIFVSFDGRGRV